MEKHSEQKGSDREISPDDSERMRSQVLYAVTEYTMYTVERPDLSSAVLGYSLHELGEDMFSRPRTGTEN